MLNTTAGIIQANGTILAAVEALAAARAATRAAEKAEKEAAAAVRESLGEARGAEIAGVKVVEIVSVTRHGVDTRTLRTAYPEVYAAVETTTEYDKIVL